MANGINQEEEFHFKDIGSPESGNNEIPQPQSQVTADNFQQSKKKLFIIAGVIIGIIFIYNIAILFLRSPKNNTEVIKDIQPISTLEKSNTTTQIPKTPPITYAGTTAPIESSSMTASMDIFENKLKKSSEQTNSEISKVATQIQEIKNVLKDLDSRLADLNYGQNNLSQELNKQKQVLNALKTSKKPKPKKQVVEKPKYFIKAAIHGRAWLMNEKGSTLTIKQGDLLPGYGSVKGIDPDLGEVSLTSGDILRFSPDDR